jgi:cyclopropane fatty-acyl-phospholipid synthase-like methyltransferase
MSDSKNALATETAAGAAPTRVNDSWNFEGEAALQALGIHGMGDGQPPDIEAVAQTRYERAHFIDRVMHFSEKDTVLELGSGMGFMAEIIAPKVGKLHCADISENFLATCSARTARFANVETHLIKYADLGGLKGGQFDKAYSTLLFIHFNFYDFTYYLQEVHKALKPGGLFFFDYNDGDRYTYGNKDDGFVEHLGIYRDARLEWVFGCMHMFSTGTLSRILPQLGFDVLMLLPTPNSCFTEILVRKKAE